MKFHYLLKLFFGFLIFAGISCVPVRKQTYLQERSRELADYPKDSVIKEFSVESYEYKLEPGDVVMIQIRSLTPAEFDFLSATAPQSNSPQADPLLSGYQIEEDGTIELPVIGKIELAGATIDDARVIIRQAVSGYLKSPVVHLKLLNFKVTVLGEVASQRTFYSYDPKITILEAVGQVGGLTEMADRANVKIVRRKGQEVNIIFVNLLDDNLIESPYYYLQPNDVIVVRPLKVKTFNNFVVKNVTLGLSVLTAITLLYLRLGN